jgi:hypothetical protein
MTLLDSSRKARAVEQRKNRQGLIVAGAIILLMLLLALFRA